MPTYKTPGVYVEENLLPLAPTSDGTGEAIAAFVGTASRGPTTPTAITSWSQFLTVYGGIGTGRDLMPFSVYNYFVNGGHTCYIVRAANADAVTSTVNLLDIQTPAAVAGIRVEAIAPGVWGNDLSVAVRVLSSADRFDLVVRLGGDTDQYLVERYPDVSANPADSRYVVSVVNSSIAGSRYIKLTDLKLASSTYVYTPGKDSLVAIENADLAAGSDGTGTPDLLAATKRLDVINQILNLNVPGVSTANPMTDIISWAEAKGSVFVVVDGPRAPANATSAQVAALYTSMVTGGTALAASSYAALYGPWLNVSDPASSVPGAMRLLPPGGAVLGQYARVDSLRGVQKAPAGMDTTLLGVLDLETRFSSTDTDGLNDKNVNSIRLVPGAGFCIMGARTLKNGYPDRYVPIRRTLMLLRKDLADITRFAIFEANNSDLWEQLSATCNQYLLTLMQSGVLLGTTPEEAYFVKCDAENNTPDQVNAGRVNIDVGVALRGPAEFLVIRIGQYEGGSATTTELTA